MGLQSSSLSVCLLDRPSVYLKVRLLVRLYIRECSRVRLAKREIAVPEIDPLVTVKRLRPSYHSNGNQSLQENAKVPGSHCRSKEFCVCVFVCMLVYACVRECVRLFVNVNVNGHLLRALFSTSLAR